MTPTTNGVARRGHLLSISVQRALRGDNRRLAPRRERIVRWARAAVQALDAEVAFRLVESDEGQALNRDFRGKDYATNVLTFAYGATSDAADAALSGDIVLCVPVIRREAEVQGKALEAHFAHMVVHGMLHLQGFDHEVPAEAEEMESLEITIMAKLGYDDPYV